MDAPTLTCGCMWAHCARVARPCASHRWTRHALGYWLKVAFFVAALTSATLFITVMIIAILKEVP